MSKVQILKIDDVLKQPIEINGLLLDSHISVVVRRSGNSLEVDSVEHNRTLYTICDSLPEDTLVELDRENFLSRHTKTYNKFIDEVEQIALKLAAKTSDTKWEEIECEEV